METIVFFFVFLFFSFRESWVKQERFENAKAIESVGVELLKNPLEKKMLRIHKYSDAKTKFSLH